MNQQLVGVGSGGGGGEQQNRRRAAEAAAAGQPQPPAQTCPRCNSNNTKFCYYNNYSLSQPRYFCKGCRRYWTHGGTLRNVPVGGGSRKSKRPKLSSSSSPSATTSTSTATTSQSLPPPPPQNDHQLPAMTNNSSSNNQGEMVVGPGISPFHGGTFLSSLAAIQAVSQSQPLSFGPNLGLLHGLGLSQDHSFQPKPMIGYDHHPHGSLFPPSAREIGGSSSDWELGVQLGPPGPDTRFWSVGPNISTHAHGNNNNNDDSRNSADINNNNNNNNNDGRSDQQQNDPSPNRHHHQWTPGFPLGTGLDDP